MIQVKQNFPTLTEAMELFQSSSKDICEEYQTLDEIYSINSMVWELIKLPKVFYIVLFCIIK